MNFRDLTASKCAMRFKDTQKVTGFHRNMLMNAHKQHVVPLCKPEQCRIVEGRASGREGGTG
jgi:hypothetical protein